MIAWSCAWPRPGGAIETVPWGIYFLIRFFGFPLVPFLERSALALARAAAFRPSLEYE